MLEEKFYERLYAYDWTGNVRELENYIESAMNFTKEGETVLRLQHLPSYYQERLQSTGIKITLENQQPATLRNATKHFQKSYISLFLEENKWNVIHAAEQLGMVRQNLQAKIREYGLKRP